MKYQGQDILTFKFLASKLKRLDTAKVIELSHGCGLLEMIIDGDALMVRREYFKNDPWIVLKDNEIRLYESREDYEIGNINASEVLDV